ncbi:MAG: glycosyltransferase [Candidatus Magasanikbacteria bacterium]|jgi:glycosyltransferase involved in cell wall biosynthesis|nr:glycosyltransferase [Candidatus Magasanikbacteria bacterium]MBT4221211.1 glycosyltransferase [Candidatus Magasanikbacteria bacterium]MBT4350640.1 glycosyltransferase [Candidatus Magasanikbacteria bacterium]MBT4541360.1 glycosyltransferase [Candidatus Magasanikbacteria bacterium]MBT6253094.1 glycosyltransferase [Candidatus Magasanikbacteria bacterium]
MHVLLVNKYWYVRGGADRIAIASKKRLEELGHTVSVFGMAHPKNIYKHRLFVPFVDYDAVTGMDRIRAGLQSIYNTDAKRRFRLFLEETRPDVIHLHNVYYQLSYSLVSVAKSMHIPVVLTTHDYQLLSPNYTLFRNGQVDTSVLGAQYYKCLFSRCLGSFSRSLAGTIEAYVRRWSGVHKSISHYISSSCFQKNLFVQSGWRSKDITVVANAVPIPKARELSHKKGEYVFFMGRLSPEKGIDVLFDAAIKTPDISYKIAGAGSLFDHLKKRITHERISNIELVGYKSGKVLTRLIDGARLVVVPSIWYENSPLSILEAMARGKVVLGSNIGGIPELLPRECIFQPNNADRLAQCITMWYSSPLSKREKCGAFLRSEVIHKYSIDHHVGKLLEVYRSVL